MPTFTLDARGHFQKLNDGKMFSKVDLSDAYLQIKVNDKCSKYLTINTHRGLYKYTRLLFGLNVAPAIFQQIMDAMLSDCEFAIPCLDNILIKSNSVKPIKFLYELFGPYDVPDTLVSENGTQFSGY
ncbi:uncharacterized protein K02A2.6-like [Octopus bimaculoides]|uniref:uncharacterized protein K02A2.6-like n=1 Tax=Octopus bimaculoides TaxID=37653 RepID=UPI00071DDEDF|nr:uncharacterized protein K02A2.6-like [Octopus bimaculoides]|eukprot:XP_014785008.1 PREDICTED: uncharacterized protein K02A2.6-like [Octopus bimaculoides]